MQNTKYVIYEDGSARICGDDTKHVELSQGADHPISAGFVGIMPTKFGHMSVECYGESISLRLKSKPEDSKVIAKMLGLWNKYEDEPTRFF